MNTSEHTAHRDDCSISSSSHSPTSSQYPLVINVSLCSPSNSLHLLLPSPLSFCSAFICGGGTSLSRFPERNRTGVVVGIWGMALAASHRSVRRNGRRTGGIWGMISGIREVRERKVFSMMTPDIRVENFDAAYRQTAPPMD